jgi:hypothetical protein
MAPKMTRADGRAGPASSQDDHAYEALIGINFNLATRSRQPRFHWGSSHAVATWARTRTFFVHPRELDTDLPEEVAAAVFEATLGGRALDGGAVEDRYEEGGR